MKNCVGQKRDRPKGVEFFKKEQRSEKFDRNKDAEDALKMLANLPSRNDPNDIKKRYEKLIQMNEERIGSADSIKVIEEAISRSQGGSKERLMKYLDKFRKKNTPEKIKERSDKYRRQLARALARAAKARPRGSSYLKNRAALVKLNESPLVVPHSIEFGLAGMALYNTERKMADSPDTLISFDMIKYQCSSNQLVFDDPNRAKIIFKRAGVSLPRD